MRTSSVFKEYCDIKKYYDEKGIELPEEIKNEFETRIYIENIYLLLERCASGNAISKDEWKSLDMICKEKLEVIISDDLKIRFEKCIDEMKDLRRCLKEQDDLLLDGFTLTKKGRKRVRLASYTVGKLEIWKTDDRKELFNIAYKFLKKEQLIGIYLAYELNDKLICFGGDPEMPYYGCRSVEVNKYDKTCKWYVLDVFGENEKLLDMAKEIEIPWEYRFVKK